MCEINSGKLLDVKKKLSKYTEDLEKAQQKCAASFPGFRVKKKNL
jgi:ribosome-interacting GTPase 1